MTETVSLPANYAPLLAEIKARVQAARIRAGLAANRELLALYWDIGRLILRAQESSGCLLYTSAAHQDSGVDGPHPLPRVVRPLPLPRPRCTLIPNPSPGGRRERKPPLSLRERGRG